MHERWKLTTYTTLGRERERVDGDGFPRTYTLHHSTQH
jgi:hypothetical protein